MKATTSYPELVGILHEARELLSRPDNNFVWSSWDNAADALREIDGFILRIESGDIPEPLNLKALFAPTGPIQEVSISSGWSQEFLRLADRFDALMKTA